MSTRDEPKRETGIEQTERIIELYHRGLFGPYLPRVYDWEDVGEMTDKHPISSGRANPFRMRP
jgi:hypothetical protein